jgi:hypothetical protein
VQQGGLKMLKGIKAKIEDIGYKRCGNCPAHWDSVDYWGEGDEGCTLHRDIFEFCPLSLLPKVVVKPYMKFQEKQEEKYYLKMNLKDLEEDKKEID